MDGPSAEAQPVDSKPVRVSKLIRFPPDLDAAINVARPEGRTYNTWVLDACRLRLEDEAGGTPTSDRVPDEVWAAKAAVSPARRVERGPVEFVAPPPPKSKRPTRDDVPCFLKGK